MQRIDKIMLTEEEAKERITDTMDNYEKDILINAECAIFFRWLLDNDLSLSFVNFCESKDKMEEVNETFEAFRRHWYASKLEV